MPHSGKRRARKGRSAYLRDSIGVVMYLLDHGGMAAMDPQVLKLYDPSSWREELFEPSPPDLSRHVVILVSEEPEMLQRFIVLQARGDRIPDGQEIRMAGLPPGLICHHAGSKDDPDFN